MDYSRVITPREEQEAEAADRRRHNAMIRAKQGNAPVGRMEQPAAPVYREGKGNAIGGQARAAKYAALRVEALAEYDRLRTAHPLALQKDVYAETAKRQNVPDKTVRCWVQERARAEKA